MSSSAVEAGHDPEGEAARDLDPNAADLSPAEPASWEPTGHPRVDAAISGLDELTVLPTSEHADVYEDAHRRLHEALADLDSQ